MLYPKNYSSGTNNQFFWIVNEFSSHDDARAKTDCPDCHLGSLQEKNPFELMFPFFFFTFCAHHSGLRMILKVTASKPSRTERLFLSSKEYVKYSTVRHQLVLSKEFLLRL